MFKIESVLQRLCDSPEPDRRDLVFLLNLRRESDRRALFAFADKVRKEILGNGVFLRGIIEFSNVCRNSCLYCGLNINNKKLQRYSLSRERIMESVQEISQSGIKTVVLQSGESAELDCFWLKDVIEEIKSRFGLAVTLSVGERRYEDYKAWREAGADRYLLKIETSNSALYQSLHPGMSFEDRLRCLKDLKGLGYETGCGNIVGLKGQTPEILAEDIIFFKSRDFEMIGIGPFIPHHQTPLGCYVSGDVNLTLVTLALTRIVCKYPNMPATTALGSLGEDYRIDGLEAGANVLMPNFTPQPYRKLYEIYPGKRCVQEKSGSCASCMETMVRSIDREIDYSRGDAVKARKAANV